MALQVGAQLFSGGVAAMRAASFAAWRSLRRYLLRVTSTVKEEVFSFSTATETR